MDLSEMLPTLHALPRPEKWRLVRIMVADLAREEEEESSIKADVSYPVWSPYDAFEAADALLKHIDTRMPCREPRERAMTGIPSPLAGEGGRRPDEG